MHVIIYKSVRLCVAQVLSRYMQDDTHGPLHSIHDNCSIGRRN